MAWDLSNAVISYQLKDGSKCNLTPRSCVWRKVANGWLRRTSRSRTAS